ncbi:MAG: serine/threonine protein phosphatase [Verrucomicrobiaceae bacterium]|nr:serine/threonine protein phosphatase [Verrucomicrobiaceae bacterium]MDB6117491.1 serine/threonine protein phosphatase [Verrucomicrobiaceae bacterium]
MGRVFAIGDVHGCLTALQTVVKHLKFEPDDEVIALGDYVDRGPDSKGVIDLLMALRKQTRLITLRGNHEVMMLISRSQGLDYFESWLDAGGVDTLVSYGASDLSEVPEGHWQFIKDTVPYHEGTTHFFVHANVRPKVPLMEQREQELYWERFDDNKKPHCSGKIMVCGHTPQKSGKPANRGHAVCIDTFSYGGGWVTCLEVATGQYWQGNQKGELREGRLEKP